MTDPDYSDLVELAHQEARKALKRKSSGLNAIPLSKNLTEKQIKASIEYNQIISVMSHLTEKAAIKLAANLIKENYEACKKRKKEEKERAKAEAKKLRQAQKKLKRKRRNQKLQDARAYANSVWLRTMAQDILEAMDSEGFGLDEDDVFDLLHTKVRRLALTVIAQNKN